MTQTLTANGGLTATALTPFRRLWRRASGNTMLMTGGTLILAVVFIALFGAALSGQSVYDVAPADRLQGPSATHWFGTDTFGRDVFARVAYGGRVSLLVGGSVALITGVIGLAIGLYAAYFRAADAILMRICDGLAAFPSILLAIAVMAALGADTSNVIIALSIVFIPSVARVVRSAALVVKQQTYIEALRSQGASVTRILWGNILPNVISPLIVQATFIFADALLVEAALSFVGAGVPAPDPSWGNMLLEGKTVLYNSWWLTVFPGLAIMATVFGVNLLGDGLRDYLDPQHINRSSR